ncbi:MAG TPA: hypothetical protein VJB82_00330 [Candidatus Peribacterales bacterium]|nr:hypothetical protein [Candidatus Peribacterales bacterium]
MAATQNNEEQRGLSHISTLRGSESAAQLIVHQPPKLHSLLTLLTDLERISEVIREDNAGDLGTSGGSGTGVAGGRGSAGVSFRDQAIQSLPSTEAMRRHLTRHLQHEVRELEKRSARMARSRKKGSAYLLNELYAKIRRIQTLIAELIDAAADVVKRLYIRLFIDHQQLV